MKGYTIQNSIDLLEKTVEKIENTPAPTTDVDAEDVSYDNTSSGLTADNVQAAIDELKSAIGTTPVLPDTETLIYNDGTNDVYRKVVDCGALPNNTTKTVDPSISDLGNIIGVIPRIGYPTDSSYCEFAGSIGRFQARSTGISIITTADWSAYTCKMVLYYTKAPAQSTRSKKTKKEE